MAPLDYVILTGYLGAVLLMGLLLARRRPSRSDFLVAGRSMSWLPVGISILATVFSAVNFTAFSEEILGHGLYVALSLPVFLIVAVPVTRWIMPFYHKQNAVSAYAFLERRFDVRVRRLASTLFIVWRVFWMGVVLYATSRLMSAATGIPLPVLVVLIGAIATAYTVAGGMRSVMWTDVAQVVVLFSAIGVALFTVSQSHDGFAVMFHQASADGLLRPFHPFDPAVFSLDPRTRISVWSALIGTCVAFLSRYGADQMVVQRYFTARSLSDAKRGFWLSAAASILVLLSLALLAFAVHMHAVAAELSGATPLPPLARLAGFITALPPGVCGLLLAGLLASTMSSVDSGIHSCCTAVVTDFRTSTTPGESLSADRWLAVTIGLATLAVAGTVQHLGSIFAIANKVINGFGSPLLALVLIGAVGGRWFNSRGVLYGGISGAVLSGVASFAIQNMALHYYAVVNLAITLALCLGLSRLFAAMGRHGNRPSPN